MREKMAKSVYRELFRTAGTPGAPGTRPPTSAAARRLLSFARSSVHLGNVSISGTGRIGDLQPFGGVLRPIRQTCPTSSCACPTLCL